MRGGGGEKRREKSDVKRGGGCDEMKDAEMEEEEKQVKGTGPDLGHLIQRFM